MKRLGQSVRLRTACAALAGVCCVLLCGLLPAPSAGLTLSSNPFLQQGEKLTSSELTEHAEQGSSVAISANGDTALIGAPAYKGFAGAAWVYARSGSTWTQQAKLVGKAASALAQQGFSVALSADGATALIGGTGDEGPGTFPGAAWVFVRSGSTWSEQAKLVGTSTTTPSEQGHSVALSADGNTALVGGSLDNKGVGAAWVFTRSGSSWTQQGEKLVGAHGSGVIDEGWGVALSGDGATALIGGPEAESGIGAAWAYTRSGTTWSEQAKLPTGTHAIGTTAQGNSVSLSGDGDTALIGGPADDNALGAAWVFTRSGSSWAQQGEKLVGEDASTEPQIGHSVSLSEDGNTALLGGYHDDTSLGAGWAFARSGSSWGEQEKLVGTGAQGGFATQGSGVAISGDGDTALLGGAGDNSGVGAAWVFARAPGAAGEPEPTPSPAPGTNTGGGGGAGSQQPQVPGTAAAAGSGIASTAAAIEELKLGCTRHKLVLNDAYIHGGRVELSGSAAVSLRGRKVTILFNERRRVAAATVGAGGVFTTTAPLPRVAVREALDTRYSAEIGGERSLHLKLTRRLLLEPPRAGGGKVTLSGRLFPPLTKPTTPVVIEQQLECGRSTIAGTFAPAASGAFHVTIAVPAAARAAIFTLKSKVAANGSSTAHGFTTYSLPLPVIL